MSDSKNDQNGTKRDQGNPFGNQGAPGPKPKFNLYWFYGIIAVMFLVVNYYFSGSKGPVETNWNKVKTIMLAQHDIDRIVVINNEKALLYLKEDRVAKYKDELEGTFTKPAVGGLILLGPLGRSKPLSRNSWKPRKDLLHQRELKQNTGMNGTGLTRFYGRWVVFAVDTAVVLVLPAHEQRWRGTRRRDIQCGEIAGQGF